MVRLIVSLCLQVVYMSRFVGIVRFGGVTVFARVGLETIVAELQYNRSVQLTPIRCNWNISHILPIGEFVI
jgi:hypothetical protein